MMWREWYGEVEEIKYMRVFVGVPLETRVCGALSQSSINHSHTVTIFLVPQIHEDGKTII